MRDKDATVAGDTRKSEGVKARGGEAEKRVRDATDRRASKRIANRGEAILVPLADKKEYGPVLAKIREGLQGDTDGVRRVRLTRAGDILLELVKGAGDSYGIQGRIKEKMGSEFEVRRLSPLGAVEYRDVDLTVTAEEAEVRLREAIGSMGATSEPVPIRIRRGPMGTQMITCVTSADVANKLMEACRLRIGLTYVTPRLAPRVTQCMACCGLGHYARECRVNPPGKQTCRNCGLLGHKMSECRGLTSCAICVREGLNGEEVRHLAGGTRCPAYRREVARIRNGR